MLELIQPLIPLAHEALTRDGMYVNAEASDIWLGSFRACAWNGKDRNYFLVCFHSCFLQVFLTALATVGLVLKQFMRIKLYPKFLSNRNDPLIQWSVVSSFKPCSGLFCCSSILSSSVITLIPFPRQFKRPWIYFRTPSIFNDRLISVLPRQSGTGPHHQVPHDARSTCSLSYLSFNLILKWSLTILMLRSNTAALS